MSLCPLCNKVVKKGNKFCNSSCSASYNNKGVVRNGSGRKTCVNCGKKINLSNKKYCNHTCQQLYQNKEKIKLWLSGKFDAIRSNGLCISQTIYNYVKNNSGGKCSICGLDKWMGKSIPLILDHKDGNGLNNSPDNLRMVCGNCDMQLPTFAGRNIGKGRIARKKYDDKRYDVLSEK